MLPSSHVPLMSTKAVSILVRTVTASWMRPHPVGVYLIQGGRVTLSGVGGNPSNTGGLLDVVSSFKRSSRWRTGLLRGKLWAQPQSSEGLPSCLSSERSPSPQFLCLPYREQSLCGNLWRVSSSPGCTAVGPAPGATRGTPAALSVTDPFAGLPARGLSRSAQ